MPGYHINRVAEDIKRELVVLLREMKDPRLHGKLLTVVRVALSGDGSSAKVYISAMEGKTAAVEAVKALQSGQGFVRGEIGRRLHLRKAPELRFVADDSIETGTQILRMMDALDIPAADETVEEGQGNANEAD
ncbi:MAG: 30S ribosome-binding factor RbfA [Oscillospiraceae bacterium]|jgi:ribosome-binding factor A|nr:30S ribosome-binding factor RbfA [Oscillospiraceae bacterium]